MPYKLYEKFEIHDTLNNQLFNEDNKLYQDVRKAMLDIAEDFIDTLMEKEIPIKVYDCWLVGSNASYNYTNDSDIDLHIIVDTNFDEISQDLIKVLYDYVKSDYNNKHDIKIKNHDVEVYLEDIKSNAVTNGIYSLKKDEWVKFPQPLEAISIDIKTSEKYNELLDRYELLDDSEISDFIDDLYLLRKESLASEGEFGEGNLIFKQFRSDGILDELKAKLNDIKSRELTLEKLNKR